MKSLFKVIGFTAIWGCTFAATYFVWSIFGPVVGILFFLFGAGLAGFAGMVVVIAIAKLFGVSLDD